MHRLPFLNIVTDILMQINVLYFIYFDIYIFIEKKSYITTTMHFTVILHKWGRYMDVTAYKISGPVWDETTFLKVFHVVLWILYIYVSHCLLKVWLIS